MSRVGKKPISIPSQVQVTLKEDSVAVKGPKGNLSCPIPPRVKVDQQDGQIVVIPQGNEKTDRANAGTGSCLDCQHDSWSD